MLDIDHDVAGRVDRKGKGCIGHQGPRRALAFNTQGVVGHTKHCRFAVGLLPKTHCNSQKTTSPRSHEVYWLRQHSSPYRNRCSQLRIDQEMLMTMHATKHATAVSEPLVVMQLSGEDEATELPGV